MAKTTTPFRIVKDSNIYNNTKSSAFGNDTLMIDVGGAVFRK